MQIKALWKFKLQYDDISSSCNALHDTLREILSKGKKPSLFFHFTTLQKDLPYHATILLVSPLKSWTARTAWVMAPQHFSVTSAEGDSWCNPTAAEVYLQAQSFMSSILPACSLPCLLDGYWMDCFRAVWIRRKLNNTTTKIVAYL